MVLADNSCLDLENGGNKGTFNIDGEGYANASDVGMNVGGQNSSIYDTSDTWSDDLSSPMEHTIILLLQMHLMEAYQMDLNRVIHLAITQQFVFNLLHQSL